MTLALAAGIGCKRREGISVAHTDEDSATLASMVHMADPRAKTQLLSGFHDVEHNAWRWTAKSFSVALRPPAGAREKGARLQFKFAVPDPVIERLNAVSLTATAGGRGLSPETYTQSGEFTYTRDVPAEVLSGEAVNVEFTLDKAIPAGVFDGRELGVIASSIALDTK
ncbi:MAG: hypothetical protein IPM24_12100 [Bryobacterales bacterium]|nr:hypothetical protein [Bryobacterales bacterium]